MWGVLCLGMHVCLLRAVRREGGLLEQDAD